MYGGHMQGYTLTGFTGFDLVIGDEFGITSGVRADMHMPDSRLPLAIHIWLLSPGMLLVVLRFSSDTVMYDHQLSKCCQRGRICNLINFRLNDCLNNQYGRSVPQILQMMEDEKLFTLNFRM
jgi:hypothetical protein